MITDTDISRLKELLDRCDASEAVIISILAKEASDVKVDAIHQRFIKLLV